MKNKEKYAKEIVEIACEGDSFTIEKSTGLPVSCNALVCGECLFVDALSCQDSIKEWAESEYVERPQDMDKEMVDAAMEDERAAQPKFPRLKNNEQRKEFLSKYRDWPVWFEVPQADEVYYRYILPDGTAIVICEYKQYVEWKEKYTDENPESTYTKLYLLEPEYHHLHDCETNETALVRKFMEVQKK